MAEKVQSMLKVSAQHEQSMSMYARGVAYMFMHITYHSLMDPTE